MKKTIGVYFIINLINNKIYVGSSTCTENRKSTHFSALIKGVHKNSYLQHAYNKYGKNAFIFHVIERDIPLENLFERELYWINYKQSNNPIYGYNNCLPNIDGSPDHSLDTKEKLRRIRYTNLYGELTDDQYNLIIQKLEQKKLDHQNRIRQEHSYNRKPVLLIDKTTGEIKYRKDSMLAASKELNVTENFIRRITDIPRRSTKGYVVVTEKNYNPEKNYTFTKKLS